MNKDMARTDATGLSQAEPEDSLGPPGFDPSREWTAYTECRPATEAVYEWRVPSRITLGVVTQFCAHMRERGAGYSRVISPVFDHWDGYRVSVPAGTLWRSTDLHADLARYATSPATIVGHALVPCRFCGRVHLLEGWNRSSGGGLLVGAAPHEYNDWEVKTCGWARAPRFRDPRELIAAWNDRHRDSDGSPKGGDACGSVHDSAGRDGIAALTPGETP